MSRGGRKSHWVLIFHNVESAREGRLCCSQFTSYCESICRGPNGKEKKKKKATKMNQQNALWASARPFEHGAGLCREGRIVAGCPAGELGLLGDGCASGVQIRS